MRKTSLYARKNAAQSAVIKRANALTALTVATARVTPYGENKLFRPEPILAQLRLGLQKLIDRVLDPADKSVHDNLINAIGEAQIRMLEIGGVDGNPGLPILYKAGDAMLRTRDRWDRTGQWGLDGPSITALKDAIDLYETVLLASSPQQMYEAAVTREKWERAQAKSPRAQELLRQRIAEATA